MVPVGRPQEGVLYRNHLGKDMKTIETQLIVQKAMRKHAIMLAHTRITEGHPKKKKQIGVVKEFQALKLNYQDIKPDVKN